MTTINYSYGYGGFRLDEDQLNFLAGLLVKAKNSNLADAGVGGPIYEYLLSLTSVIDVEPISGGALTSPLPGVDESVFDWLTAAVGINSGRSPGGSLIQEYTSAAFLIQNGSALTSGRFYTASNNIAIAVAQGIINNLGALPSIEGLGAADAGSIAATLFSGVFAPWAGTSLFAFLSEPQFYSDWLLTTDIVGGSVPNSTTTPTPNGTVPAVFNSIPGAYELISTLDAFHQGVSFSTQVLAKAFGGADTSDPLNLTTTPSNLETATQNFLLTTYGLTRQQFPNLGYGTPFNSSTFDLAPQYVAGTTAGEAIIVPPPSFLNGMKSSALGTVIVGGPRVCKVVGSGSRPV